MNNKLDSTFAVIIAAAGKSSRFADETQVKKPFAQLLGKPVWLHSVEKFVRRDEVKQIFVVVSPDDIIWFREYYVGEINQYLLIVLEGGKERVDSVQNALKAVREDIDFIAVHDAARPCVSDQEIDAVFEGAQTNEATMLASPIIGTVKRVQDEKIVETISRKGLWEAQTPQVFRRSTLIRAYANRGPNDPTDDAELVEKIGCPVYIVPAERWNLKITTQNDLFLAENIVLCQNNENRPDSRGKIS